MPISTASLAFSAVPDAYNALELPPPAPSAKTALTCTLPHVSPAVQAPEHTQTTCFSHAPPVRSDVPYASQVEPIAARPAKPWQEFTTTSASQLVPQVVPAATSLTIPTPPTSVFLAARLAALARAPAPGAQHASVDTTCPAEAAFPAALSVTSHQSVPIPPSRALASSVRQAVQLA